MFMRDCLRNNSIPRRQAEVFCAIPDLIEVAHD
jgi:hypothetical protein